MSKLGEYCDEVTEISGRLYRNISDHTLSNSERAALNDRLDVLAHLIREHDRAERRSLVG